MVTIEYIACAAMQYNTTISRAFMKALGIAPPAPAPISAPIVVSIETVQEIDRSLAWCFANHGSPLEGRV